MTEDTPEIKDHKGPWDEFLNRIILILPWVGVLAGGIYLGVIGDFSTDITLEGAISITPIINGVVAVFIFTYILAIMKFYGTSPVSWLFKKLHNLAKNYNPEE